jgi:hypothetical protein
MSAGSEESSKREALFDPIIRAFPTGAHAWRIDWFGRVGYPSRAQRGRNPSVCVHLSRVVAEGFLDDPNVLLSPESTAPGSQRVACWVSVGTLALLRVGDIWHQQRLLATPDYELATFTGLPISFDVTKTVKAGIDLDNGEFLLPVGQHPWHMADTHSYCVILGAPSGGRIIVPCMELVRFYFGSSASLLNRLFDPQLQRDELFTKYSLEPTYGILNIALAPGISRGSASDVARIAADRGAWTAARSIARSCVSASARNEPVYAKAHFPFTGTTTLTAAGKWLKRDAGPRDFVVFSLRSCSHPFPFESLHYTLADGAGTLGVSRTEAATSASGGRSDPRKRSKRSHTLLEKDPGQQLQPHTAYVGAKAKFPDLLGKHVSEHVTVRAQEPASSAGSSKEVAGAIGDASGSSRTRSTDVSEGGPRNEPPAFLSGVLRTLMTFPGLDIVVMTRSQHAWTAPVPPLVNRVGEVDRRVYLELDPNAPIREFGLVAIRRAGRCATLVVLEDDPPYIWMQSGDTVAPTEQAVHTALLMNISLTSRQRHRVTRDLLLALVENHLGPLDIRH